MQLLSLLNDVSFPLLESGFYIPLNWLEKFIKILIEGVGITGLGIIVFTLILKAITLPFDIYQRVKMRKQTLIMRNMQEDLDKLQKQYANDKTMYNQKMMELYKKNGYSMFGACLPMIVSLVILMVAFWALNGYSQYANLALYENMASAYNDAILVHSVEGDDYQLDGEGDLKIVWNENSSFEKEKDGVTLVYTMSKDLDGIKRMSVKVKDDADKYLYYTYSLETTKVKKDYQIDTERLYASQKSAIDAIKTEKNMTTEEACLQFVVDLGAEAAAKSYRDNPPSFLWIKNIWYPDVSYNHPVQTYSEFVSSRFVSGVEVTLQDGTKAKVNSIVTEQLYNNITSKLDEEKTQPNGYFILIVLSIGLMVLSQFISMKSQKESNKYQTVDGSGAASQKMMMIIMPLIYAIFAFMYSASFSIYMTMSSLISILVTVFSNLIIGRIFRKKEEEEFIKAHSRTVPWKQNEADKKGKKKK